MTGPFWKNDSIKFCFWLGAAVFISYGNALFNGFVWDDGYLILNNQFIRSFAHFKDVFFNDVTVMTPLEKASGYYRPVSLLYLMLSYKWWGLNPAGFHLGNILLHLFNVWLIFFIMRKITAHKACAFLTALIFAVHPVHVEAVTPAYNYMGILAAFFSLAAFLFFIYAGKAPAHQIRFVAAASLCLFLAVFSKEEALMMPFVFLLYDVYFLSDFRVSTLRKRLGQYIVYFFICAVYILMRIKTVESGAVAGLWSLDPQMNFNVMPAANGFLHALTVLKGYVLYIGLLAVPWQLNAFHIITPVTSPVSLEAVAVVTVYAAFCCFFFRNKKSQIAFFVLLFFVSGFLVSNVIPIGGLFAERLVYFPSVAYGAIVSIGFVRLTAGRKRIAGILLAGLLLFYGLQTVARNYVWRNDITLWRDTEKKSPSELVYLNLASAYQHQRYYDEAIEAYGKALPFSRHKKAFIYNEIGKIYGAQRMYGKALEEFEKSLQFNDRLGETYYNIGITHFNQGREEQAVSYFGKSIRADGRYPWPYYGLGLVYNQRGDTEKSRDMLRKALDIDPDFRLARELLK